MVVTLTLAGKSFSVFGKEKWDKAELVHNPQVSKANKISRKAIDIQLVQVRSAPLTLTRKTFLNTYLSLFLTPILLVCLILASIVLWIAFITYFSCIFVIYYSLAFAAFVLPFFGLFLCFSVVASFLFAILIINPLCDFVIRYFETITGIHADKLSLWAALFAKAIMDYIVDTLLGAQTARNHQQICERITILFKSCSSIGTLRFRNMDQQTFNIIRECVPSVMISEIGVCKKKSLKTEILGDSNYM